MWVVKVRGKEYRAKGADTVAINIALEIINPDERVQWAFMLYKEMIKLIEGEAIVLDWPVGEIVIIHSWPEIRYL